MTSEFAIGKVATDVIQHLERHRETTVSDQGAIARAIETALEPIRAAYVESQLPPAYFQALEVELRAALPAKWRAVAEPFTALEARGFGLWRGGDLGARLAYVAGGLALGGLIVWLPFIPIFKRWLPFVLAAAGWWLPDAMVAWHRRRYAKELGRIIRRLEDSQAALEARVSMIDLLPPGSSL